MMLSPRLPYVSPKMRCNALDDTSNRDAGNQTANFEGLHPADAAKLFSELISAQT